MSKYSKIILKILSGKSDNNIEFNDLMNVLIYIGFELRIKSSHHIFYKDNIDEIINLQPDKNNKAKNYQVKQVRNLIIKLKLGEFTNE